MARFEVSGLDSLDSLSAGLKQLGEDISAEAGDRALTKGGELLADYFVGAIANEGLVDTGEFAESIKAAKPSNAGGKHVDVYPHGKRKDGKRNAEIGAYHEYGVTRTPPKKSLPATHWMSNTVDDVEEEILDTVEAEILKTIDEHLGG